MASSSISRILATHLADLQNAIVEPAALAVKLFAEGFIPREVRSRVTEVGTGLVKHEKAFILLDAIERYFGGVMSDEERSADFLKLLSIFKMHVPIDNVARAMEKEYEEKGFIIHQAGRPPSEKGAADAPTAGCDKTGTRPKLPHILSFPFPSGHASIVQKIAKSHETFGILLLDDDDGTIVHSIAVPGQTPSDITLAILRRWIQGEGRKPITWATLIAVIREAGSDTLASDITAGLPNLPPA